MAEEHSNLDPEDWSQFRAEAHRMLDDMVDALAQLRQRPVWQPASEAVRALFDAPLPTAGQPLAQLHEQCMQSILPYVVGNAHPGFMGWVHGGGTPVGMMAAMMAAGLNVNAGGRNQIALDVEQQVVRWMRDLLGFPATADGVLTGGTSAATVIALVSARNEALDAGGELSRLVAYASTEVHGSLRRALMVIGLDAAVQLQAIDCNAQLQIDLSRLEAQIAEDRAAGLQPWLLVGSAGTVNSGAVDDLSALAALARAHGLWFHVDGALGALAMLAPEIAPRLRGIGNADSLAMDFHKWGQVPYAAGMVMMRDGAQHRRHFMAAEHYLQRDAQGLAGHSPWPCDFGIDLSREFAALKVWMTFQAYGSARLGRMIARGCRLAADLAARLAAMDDVELMAPQSLNIVCFRYCGGAYDEVALDRINRELVRRIQLSGLAAPSLTCMGGRAVIRVALVNHRTSLQDIDRLLATMQSALEATLAGDGRIGEG